MAFHGAAGLQHGGDTVQHNDIQGHNKEMNISTRNHATELGRIRRVGRATWAGDGGHTVLLGVVRLEQSSQQVTAALLVVGHVC